MTVAWAGGYTTESRVPNGSPRSSLWAHPERAGMMAARSCFYALVGNLEAGAESERERCIRSAVIIFPSDPDGADKSKGTTCQTWLVFDRADATLRSTIHST